VASLTRCHLEGLKNPSLFTRLFFIMPSIVFSFGDTSKEVDLKDVNSPEDLASNMKEVITEEEAKPSYPESFQAAADDYELSEDVI
tara:strand:- start:24 stop:281 length:258 start_codon:yes stop_codon:yes gene_type:complete